MRPDAGFTLIEVLVATAITAILSVMGLILLNNALSAEDQLETTLETVQELELARSVIKSDLSQISTRIPRDEFGQRSNQVFEGGFNLTRDRLMSFVANGRQTVGRESVVPTLQYVEYVFEDKTLSRVTRPHIDGAPDDLERRRVLLENVEDVQIRFLSPGGWSDLWEVPAQPGVLAAPQAVAIEIVHPRYGLIETQFVTNAAQ